MKTVQQINTIENNYIRQCGGILNVTEGSWKQNTISRNKIRALKNQHGTCYIGNINAYDNKPILKEYYKGMIYNFECDFAIPEYNEELVEMIKQYNSKPYSSEIIKDIKRINNKVAELNGINVMWV